MQSHAIKEAPFPAFCILLLGISSITAQAQAQTFTEVAVGEYHVCALMDTGEVDCVTDASTTRYDATDDLPLMKALSAGQQHTCGITVEDEVSCWGGLNYYQEQDVPVIDERVVSISAGTLHTCAIDETSRAWCWGLNTNEQTQVPGNGYGKDGLGFVKVDANATTSCGIQTDGSITCWSTNPLLADTSRLTGSFIDLDMSNYNGCGLTESGDIQCWLSVFEPPANGPYTDLVVSLASICGLNQNQELDCTFNPRIESDESLFSTGDQFISIESRALSNMQNSNICGVTVSSTIACVDAPNLVGVPGMEPEPEDLVFDLQLSLTATVYTAQSIELFWTPLSGGFPLTFVEIHRNGELLDTVDSRFSWLDDGFENQDGELINYRIRPIDEFGNSGPFSNTIVVDPIQRTVAGGNTLNIENMPEPVRLIEKLTLLNLSNSLLIYWEGPSAGEDGVMGYEIRINNQTIDITDTDLYIFRNFNYRECYIVTIAALSYDESYLDFRSNVSIGGQDRRNCTQG